MNHYCIPHLLNDGEPFWDLETNRICFFIAGLNGYIVMFNNILNAIDGEQRQIPSTSIAFNNRYAPIEQLPTEYKLEQILYRKDRIREWVVSEIKGDEYGPYQYTITDKYGTVEEVICCEERKAMINNGKYDQLPPTDIIEDFRKKHHIPEFIRIEPAIETDIDIITTKFVPEKFSPGGCYRINTPTITFDALLCAKPLPDAVSFVRIVPDNDKLFPVTFTISPDQLMRNRISITKI